MITRFIFPSSSVSSVQGQTILTSIRQPQDSAYYVGAVHENEVENGQKLVKILLDKGDRDIGLIGWEQGDATWLGRYEGYKEGVEEWNKAAS
jgi:DNA-binding LacI/PurR family transcriptional regulator